jgi:hypothetical protein
MVVVAALELVLNYYGIPRLILSDEVNAERSSSLLPFRTSEGETCHLVYHVEICLEPKCKVVRLMPPHLTQRYPLDLADHGKVELNAATPPLLGGVASEESWATRSEQSWA